MRQKLRAYGLKWEPFSREVPVEALYRSPLVESLCWRVEHLLLEEGGFGSVIGSPGTGKSASMRLLERHLLGTSTSKVVALEHASGSVSSFYRELGECFGVELTPRNRWGGFRALRESWCEHMETTLLRPVLLIDEAQEMNPKVRTELRLLSSMKFDSRVILAAASPLLNRACGPACQRTAACWSELCLSRWIRRRCENCWSIDWRELAASRYARRG